MHSSQSSSTFLSFSLKLFPCFLCVLVIPLLETRVAVPWFFFAALLRVLSSFFKWPCMLLVVILSSSLHHQDTHPRHLSLIFVQYSKLLRLCRSFHHVKSAMTSHSTFPNPCHPFFSSLLPSPPLSNTLLPPFLYFH